MRPRCDVLTEGRPILKEDPLYDSLTWYAVNVLRYSSTCRCYMCYALDPISMHGPNTKHTKHLPQSDE